MPPKSRGSAPTGLQSRSTPNLPILHSLNMTSPDATSRQTKSNPFSRISQLRSEETSPMKDGDTGRETYSDSESSEDVSTPKEQQREHRKLLHQRSSQSNLNPSSSQLFPPFYNRPPTPLPPSPSLTSLLRPSFSTQTSHHTTPESSDVESQMGGSAVAAVEKSARSAEDVPRASPKVQTYEYYGFALYLASSAAFLMCILWAFLPSPFLHQLGIYYYPNRWWALAVPAWLVVSVMYIYVALASYNTGYLTLPMGSIENLVDEAAQIAIVDRDGKLMRPKKANRHQVLKRAGRHSRQNSAGSKNFLGPGLVGKDVDWKTMWNEGTDAVLDVPIGGVCEILYGAGRDLDAR